MWGTLADVPHKTLRTDLISPLEEVEPETMQSRKVPGLYFAGEVLDIDGETGGFNFQGAWSTAYLAARAISQK